MRILFLTCLLFSIDWNLYAQPASTEIYLVNIKSKDGKITCDTPVNITKHDGYDNQPEFSPDGKKILYVSMPDTNQSDIFEYLISDSTTYQLTATSESEYSPRFTPDKMHVTFVRVDADKGQRLYYSDEEFSESQDLLYGLDSIGYYSWINDSVIALASLHNGLELYIYELKSGQFIAPQKGIGRCMLKIPGTADLMYTKKSGDKIKLIRYSVLYETSTDFCEGLGDVEDYTFTPDGVLLAGKDGKLFSCKPGEDAIWKEVADFSKSAGSFYRMTVSPDGKRLAMVAFKGKRP